MVRHFPGAGRDLHHDQERDLRNTLFLGGEMRKLLVFLLCIPMLASGENLQTDPGEFVHAVQGLVRMEKAIISKGHGPDAWDVGLLIHEKELFSSSSELRDNGRLVLEKARRIARQANKKLTILMPDERQDQDYRPVTYSMYGGQVRRNVFVGPYVYIVIAQEGN